MKYAPRPVSNTFSKIRRAFGHPVSKLKPVTTFIPIPPTNIQPANLNYDPTAVLGAEKIASIEAAKKIVFQMVGDTGGINGTSIQDEIAVQMESQYQVAPAKNVPAFFFHLGDVIYYNGITTDYPSQFYEPYQYYPGPIFAIPGNHDGDTFVYAGDPPDNEPSLTGFFQNFCTPQRIPAPGSPYRYTMDQPWPYWVLDAPFVTIIGLYSNVDGTLDAADSAEADQTQYNWFVQQLKNADTDKCLVLTVHHPPFSLDTTHGGYQDILNAIDQATADAGRTPDAVFTGHVHNYQRFTRAVNKLHYPYIIAGAGGYANTAKSMHQIQTDSKGKLIKVPFKTTNKEVVLEKYNETQPGFLRITVDANHLKGEYFTNSFEVAPPSTTPFDTFSLNWRTHKIRS